MISLDRFLPSKEDPGTGYCPRQGQNHIQNSHVLIFSSATILKRLDSMLGRSFPTGQPLPFVNSVY